MVNLNHQKMVIVHIVNYGNKKSSDEYYLNPQKQFLRSKRWKDENKAHVNKIQKQYYESNREKISLYQKDNRESANINHRNWVSKNKEKEQKRINECRKKRLKNDPIFKMRLSVSHHIGHYLKKQNIKKDHPTWSKLPYTPKDLKEHLEKLFEPWMNWQNYGNQNKHKKTWNVDHIIPQSKLLYDSLEHPNFLKCWSLENLRPLEAFENLKKRDKII